MRGYDIENMGARIARRRAELGMSQKDLALRLDVTRSCVANWESGNRAADVRYWRHISKALGISLELLCGADELESTEEHLDLSRLSKESREKLVSYYGALVREDSKK